MTMIKWDEIDMKRRNLIVKGRGTNKSQKVLVV